MDDFLGECPEDEQYCFSEMTSDWLPSGPLTYSINRGCAKDNITEIREGDSKTLSWKDAIISCEHSSCNGGADVIDYYTETTPSNVISCHACQLTEYVNGSVADFFSCDDNSESSSPVIRCPVYAQNSCTISYYSATNGVPDEGFLLQNVTNRIVRACSPFFLNSDYESTLSGISYTVTRESCTTDKCNRNQSKEVCRSVQVNSHWK